LVGDPVAKNLNLFGLPLLEDNLISDYQPLVGDPVAKI
jgi:hypothetical protein